MKCKNRGLAFGIIVVLLISLFTGCSSGASVSAPPSSIAPPSSTAPVSSTAPASSAVEPAASKAASSEVVLTNPVNMIFVAHNAGGANFNMANAIAQIWYDYLPAGSNIDVQPISPGAFGAPYLLQNGDGQATVGVAAPTRWAIEEGLMDYGPLTGVSAIMGNMDTEHVLSYFTKDFVDKTGISTLEELVAQKYPVNIACKTKGSMGEKATEMAFKLLGVSYDDIKSWGGTISFLEAQQAANLIKDGKADLMIDATTVGQAITTELSLTKDLVFFELGDELRDKFFEVGMTRSSMPAGSWKGQDKEIQTVGANQCILIRSDTPDDVAYILTKAICENKPRLVETVAIAETSFFPETAWEPNALGAPIHPGAERYYREMGYMK